MKKYLFSLAVMMVTMLTSANAMSYEQAREQALFLTDKMAYELNLNEAQYEAAYEVNLDYLMGVNTYDDVYSAYWTRRNLDLSYILFDWQYRLFCEATYFYRPIWWEAGHWHFGIYARYPHRHHYYFGRPHFYSTYRGGHAWHMNGNNSWYHTNFRHQTANHGQANHRGMRDGWNRGDYNNSRSGRGNNAHNDANGNRRNRDANNNAGTRRGNNNSHNDMYDAGTRHNDNAANNGYSRQSSTRSTVNRGAEETRKAETTAPRRSSTSTATPRTTTPSRSYGTGSTSGSSRPSSSFSGSSRSSAGASHSGGASRSGSSHSGGRR